MGYDKRKHERFRKRLSLKFGTEEPKTIGFTEDISDTGIFIRSVTPVAPGSILVVEIKTSTNEVVRLKGRIMWAKKVPQNMMHRIKGGMGLIITEFLSGEETYNQLCAERARR